MMTVL